MTSRLARRQIPIAAFRSVRECLDQHHTEFETPKKDRADDDLLSHEKRLHPYTSPEKAGKHRAYRAPDA
jgi:hypothetical protein